MEPSYSEGFAEAVRYKTGVRAHPEDPQLFKASPPHAQSAGGQAADRPNRAEPARRFRRRVLLVDDDDATRSALAHWFEENYEVTEACDGLEGVASAKACRPDVIITDVSMPKLDGFSMVRSIRNVDDLARVPVVFLTGETTPESVGHGFLAGAFSYLAKPVDLDRLEHEVLAALASRGGNPTTRPVRGCWAP